MTLCVRLPPQSPLIDGERGVSILLAFCLPRGAIFTDLGDPWEQA